jgi:hypothetical protein
MKKLIALATLALIGTGFANARLVRSRTVGERAKTPTEWIVRTGLSINNATGSAVSGLKGEDTDRDGDFSKYSIGPQCGWDVSVAFNKPIGSSGAYWGMELGIGSRGASASTEYTWDDGEEYENSKQHMAQAQESVGRA